MPVRYIISKERQLVINAGEGRVTFSETKVHQDQLVGAPAFDLSFDQLCDYTTASETDIFAGELMALADRDVFSPTSKRAVAATKPAFVRLGRAFEAYHGQRERVHVFHDRDEALKWLGIPANELASPAQSFPPDVDQTAKLVMPKDLDTKSKRIEKTGQAVACTNLSLMRYQSYRPSGVRMIPSKTQYH
jgi:hypothetical protein